MRWSYAGTSDALYVYLADGEPASQRELDDGTLVDLDADGSLLGIEVLGLHSGWHPNEVAAAFGLTETTTSLLWTLALAVRRHVVIVQPGHDQRPESSTDQRLASSAQPMAALVPA